MAEMARKLVRNNFEIFGIRSNKKIKVVPNWTKWLENGQKLFLESWPTKPPPPPNPTYNGGIRRQFYLGLRWINLAAVASWALSLFASTSMHNCVDILCTSNPCVYVQAKKKASCVVGMEGCTDSVSIGSHVTWKKLHQLMRGDAGEKVILLS